MRLKIGPSLWAAAIVAGGAVLRFKGLAAQSLWLDEIHSAHVVGGTGLANIIADCQGNFTPPLYFLLLRLWTAIFGGGEIALRSFSALAGALGILSVYLLGKALFSRTTALVAAALTGLNIYHLAFSQEARSYALLFLLTNVSVLCFTGLIRKPGLRAGLSYAAAATLLVYTHYFGFFVLAAEAVAAAFIILGRDDKRQLLKAMSIGYGAAFVLFLPWLKVSLSVAKTASYWTDKPGPDFFVGYFRVFLGAEPLLVLLFSGLLLLYLVSIPHAASCEHHKIILLCWLFVPLFIPYVWSFGHPSPLTDRNAIIILPAILLAASRALEGVVERHARRFLYGILLIMSALSIIASEGRYYAGTAKEPWREVARFVVESDPGHRYPAYGHPYYDYYLNRFSRYAVEVRQADDLEKIRRDVETGLVPGAWILEGHVVRPEQGVNHAYLEAGLLKAAVLNLYRVRATLYVRPDKLEILEGRHRIPLSVFTADRRPQEQTDEMIVSAWNIKLVSPEFHFPAGRYLIKFNARGSEAHGRFSRLRAAVDRAEAVFELGATDKDYDLPVEIREAGKFQIVLEFDNDAFDEARQKDRNVWINAVEIRKPKTS